MWTGNVHAERRRLIAEYREKHPTETAGCGDVIVEVLMFALPDASTEALVYMLRERGYTVALEVG